VQGGDRTIINLSEQSQKIKTEQRTSLEHSLRNGELVTTGPLNKDFAIIILLAAVFLLTIVRSSLKNFQPVTRFLLFRGINEPSSGDTNVLFHWQTTLLNLVAFFIIGLFACQAMAISGGMPGGMSAIMFWFISLGIIIAALTTRHLICSITGNLSGQKDAFNAYLVGVYQFYHFTAFILFILIVVKTFTVLLPAEAYVMAGICGIVIMYLIRAIRLLLIFMNRNISIFYLILYLCALEILPLAIVIRYFSAPVEIG
jgi:hypothetical protein